MTTTPDALPTTYTVRGPEDLVAMAPVVLGFVPTDSVAMLTFGAARPFHARVDLPPPGSPPSEVGEMVRCLRDPAVRHGVRRVALVVFSATPAPADRVARRLVRGFEGAGIDVVDLLRADGSRWYPLRHGRRAAAAGIPYDLASHRFTAQAVLDGLVTRGSRREVEALVRPRPDRVPGVAALLAAGGSPATPSWVARTCARLVREDADPTDEEAARLLAAVARDPCCSDAAWWWPVRSGLPRHVDLWTDLVARAPEEVVPPAAAVLAALAWRAGHGALAWCAVDRAREVQPEHRLAGLVTQLLAGAVPPPEEDDPAALAPPG